MIETVSQVAGFCHSSSNLTMQIMHLLINLKRAKVGLRTTTKDTQDYYFLLDRIPRVLLPHVPYDIDLEFSPCND